MLNDKVDIFEIVASLSEQIKNDRKEQQRMKSVSKDRGNAENQELRRRLEEL